MADSEAILAPQEPGLRHHFDDSAQQLESSTLGMWVFLVTEVMFFGGLFCAYLIYRRWYFGDCFLWPTPPRLVRWTKVPRLKKSRLTAISNRIRSTARSADN